MRGDEKSGFFSSSRNLGIQNAWKIERRWWRILARFILANFAVGSFSTATGDFIVFPLGGRAESLRSVLGRRLSQAGIRGTGRRVRVSGCLLLKDHRRPADSLSLKVDGHLDTVGDLDERNAFIHPVIPTVESHCPLNLTRACTLASNRKRQRLGLRYPANGKSSRQIQSRGTGLNNLV